MLRRSFKKILSKNSGITKRRGRAYFSGKSHIIGIDLGTTNSCVSVVDGGETVIIENSEGQRTTPSVVAFTKDNQIIVGAPAKRQAVTNPSDTFYATKRLIGRKWKDPEIQEDIKHLGFNVIEHTNGDAWVQRSNGDKYSPSQIGAFVLGKMKETAENYLGNKVTSAVITVPAYFNDAQRQATKDAGMIAGLTVERIINEPTAAAMAYGLEKEKDMNLAVYDLGGGTFDISILEMTGGVFEVKATNGDTSCGGEDIDSLIVGYVLNKFKDETGINLRGDKIATQRIREASEKAKMELSSANSSEINLPYITMNQDGPQNLALTITKKDYNGIIKDFVKKTLEPCRICLKDAQMTTSDIDSVILVGGSTRIPLVQELVKDFFGKQPSKGVNPDEAVAIGAAIQSGIMEGGFEGIVLIDVVPLSLGTEVVGGIFSKIIDRNQAIPCSNTQVYTTTEDNQTSIVFPVYQGEREIAKENKYLGEFTLGGLAPAPRGVAKVEATMQIDNNGILNVTAKDKSTGKEASITIQPSGGLTKNEIERMVRDSEKAKAQDMARKKVIEARNNLDQSIHQSKQALIEFGDRIPAEEKTKIDEKISGFEKILNDSNKSGEDLERAVKELNAEVMRIGSLVYGGQQQQSSGEGKKK